MSFNPGCGTTCSQSIASRSMGVGLAHSASASSLLEHIFFVLVRLPHFDSKGYHEDILLCGS